MPDDEAVRRLILYAELLQKWNRSVNLTAIRDESGILHRHLMEGAFAASLVSEETRTVLDFGSGGGIPGIPIAILKPLLKVTLADASSKKAAFLREVGRQLGLSIYVHAQRVNLPIHEAGFDLVTMRAVDRLGMMLLPASRQLAPGGRLMLLVSERQASDVRGEAGRVLGIEALWSRHPFRGSYPGIVLIVQPSPTFHVETMG